MSFNMAPKATASGVIVVSARKKGRNGRGNGRGSDLALSMLPKATSLSSKTEIKYYSFLASNAATVSSVGTVTKLTAIPQSLGAAGRTGDELGLLAWEMNLSVHASSSDLDGTAVRVIIFRWEVDDSAVSATVLEILEGSTVAYSPELMWNQESARDGQFTILHDKTYGVAGNGPVIAIDRVTQKLPSLGIRFVPGAATGKGHLFMLAISGKAATQPTLNAYTRVYYEDK